MCRLLMPVPTLGEIVLEFRTARNISRPVFAQRAKVHPSTLYNIEKGLTDNLRTEQFERVAGVMGIDAETLKKMVSGADAPMTLPADLASRIRQRAEQSGYSTLEWIERLMCNAPALDYIAEHFDRERRERRERREKMAPPVYTNLDTGRQMEITPPRRPKARKQAKRK